MLTRLQIKISGCGRNVGEEEDERKDIEVRFSHRIF
jgi:hypothetical protein